MLPWSILISPSQSSASGPSLSFQLLHSRISLGLYRASSCHSWSLRVPRPVCACSRHHAECIFCSYDSQWTSLPSSRRLSLPDALGSIHPHLPWSRSSCRALTKPSPLSCTLMPIESGPENSTFKLRWSVLCQFDTS